MIGTIIKQVVKLLPKYPYGFPWWLKDKESTCIVRDLGSISGLGREGLPTPLFWPGEFHEQRILAGYSPWGGHKELDTLGIFHFHLSITYVPWERVYSFQLEYEWKETVFGPRKILWRESTWAPEPIHGMKLSRGIQSCDHHIIEAIANLFLVS